MYLRTTLLLFAVLLTFDGAAPSVTNVPPFAGTDVPLSDGRTLHTRELPLGRMDGVVRDGAQFDRSGMRIAFLATFPNGAIEADWRRANPTQAYVADVSRRSLTALTSDGRATAIRWRDENHVTITDAGSQRVIAMPAAASLYEARAQLEPISPATSGTLVSPPDEFRLQVLKTSAQSYAIGQVGAVRLRTVAIARNSGFALLGAFLVWIDAQKNGGPQFARNGPDTVLPPAFAGSAYADELNPVLPLGHVVYQGAYRNGVAYFAFSYGLVRIVATTTDFLNYVYPSLPKQPAFNVGDEFGGGADGALYFADPENGIVQYWRGDRWVERTMQFPAGVSDTHRIFDAMARLSPGDTFRPPMRPDADALDAALLEWRVYPIGDTTGTLWIASYLGRAFVAGADLRFSEIREPGYPFAVLGRTDDGRLWGATPVSRVTHAGAEVSALSQLLSSRDGVHWIVVSSLEGDPGGVGLHGGVPWVAMSAFEHDAAGVVVERIAKGSARAASTGAVYAGEDMFFAQTGSGWYLVCGGEPGTRADDGSGPLVALRLDSARLFSFDDSGRNAYLSDRIDPLHLISPGEPAPFLASSVTALGALSSSYLPTLVSDAPQQSTSRLRSLTVEAEREFEIEYAWRPYPAARVNVSINGNAATVRRTLERGPLAVEGQVERWTRDAAGIWRLSQIASRWRM